MIGSAEMPNSILQPVSWFCGIIADASAASITLPSVQKRPRSMRYRDRLRIGQYSANNVNDTCAPAAPNPTHARQKRRNSKLGAMAERTPKTATHDVVTKNPALVL